MDVESDRENGINSFPARFSDQTTTRTSIQLTLLWFACFAISDPMSEIWFLGSAGLMSIANVVVILMRNRLDDFQTTLFRVSMLTGWVSQTHLKKENLRQLQLQSAPKVPAGRPWKKSKRKLK